LTPKQQIYKEKKDVQMEALQIIRPFKEKTRNADISKVLQAPTSGFIPLRQKATIVATAVSFTMLSPIVSLPRGRTVVAKAANLQGEEGRPDGGTAD
jgi:hypothetical protein